MEAYTESRELKPDDEHGFHGEVPREIIQHNSDGETLDKVEETKNDPVGEPLDVILRRGCLDGFEREISRKKPADEIGYGSSEGVDG